MPRKRRYWTEEEDAILRERYGQVTAREIATELGRALGSVYHRATFIGLRINPKATPEPVLIALIKELHPQGFSDAEIKRYAKAERGLDVDRHRIGILRNRLGLESNKHSERSRRKVAAKTAEQCAAAGVEKLKDLQTNARNQWKRDLGWPESLTLRAVQALELFWHYGQLTRLDLCRLMKIDPKKRTEPISNAKGGTVLAELAKAGFISRVRKAVKVPIDLPTQTVSDPNRPPRVKNVRTKSLDLYILNPGVKPSDSRKQPANRSNACTQNAVT